MGQLAGGNLSQISSPLNFKNAAMTLRKQQANTEIIEMGERERAEIDRVT